MRPKLLQQSHQYVNGENNDNAQISCLEMRNAVASYPQARRQTSKRRFEAYKRFHNYSLISTAQLYSC